jgi:PTH1 family peptidyl-tRNA hydrolase
MKLFVGLGNPGSSYARHRHNVGFMALDRIAERHRLGAWRKRFHGLMCEGLISGRRVTLLKPQTYMNDSGQSVAEAQRYLKLSPGDVFVFHDEIDLAPGKLKVKVGGGNAGHNGLRSISAHMGNEYGRVRIGVGHPGSKELVHGYVLHDFARADLAWLRPMLDAIADACGRLAAGDDARFLTDVARALHGDARTKQQDATPEDTPKAQPRATRTIASAHPAGERNAKRASALADNLKKWLKGRRDH